MKQTYSRKNVLLICVMLALATLVVYWQVLGHEFIDYDDNEYIYENDYVKAGLTQEGLIYAFTSSVVGHWQPLTWLSHMLDCELYGLEPGGHHLTSVLFHIGNTLLLFLVLNAMTGNLWSCAFVAAAFALHPLRVESVAWASERKDVLSTFFFMMTMAAYLHYVRRPGINRYLLILVAFVLGLMAKSMLVTLPFVLLLLDYWPLARISSKTSSEGQAHPQSGTGKFTYQSCSLPRLIAEKIPLFVLVTVVGVIIYIIQRDAGAVTGVGRLGIKIRIANALVSYIGYISKMLYPRSLAVMYPHPLETLPLWQPIICAMILAIISLGVVYVGRQKQYLLVGWLWYLGTLVPVIGLVQIGVQAMADHFTYIPLTGLFIIIGWGIPDIVVRLRHRKITLSLSAAVVLTALGVSAWFQVRHWRDSMTLFKHAEAVVRNNWWAHLQLGVALNEQGKVNEAVSEWTKVLQLGPGTPPEGTSHAHFNIGAAAFKQGEYDDAVKHFNEVSLSTPHGPDACYYLGLSYYQQGKYELAILSYNEALKLKPDYPEAINNLGMALEKQGKIDEAISEWEKVLRFWPGSSTPSTGASHFNLGRTMLNQGRYGRAIKHFNEALRAKPNWSGGYYYLGLAYHQQGAYELSIQNYNKALRFDPDNPDIIKQLAMALEKQGKIDQAIIEWKKILQMVPDDADAHFRLGLAMAWQGEYDDAVKHFNEALRTRSDWADVYYYLGLAYARQGNFDESIKQYTAALRLKPDRVDTMNNLAWVLATAEEAKFQNPSEAVRLAERACELTRYEQPDLLDTLTVAYAAEGRFDDAIEMAEKAIKLAEEAGQMELAKQIRNRLQLYRAGQPYIEERSTQNSINP